MNYAKVGIRIEHVIARKWLFTRCPIKNELGWFPCVQVTSYSECIRLVSVRSSLPCSNMGVRIEPTETVKRKVSQWP